MSDALPGLAEYCRLLEEARHRFNLIGPNENIQEHCEDCLSAAPLFYEEAARLSRESSAPVRLVDLGTGAGLPGIPLALWFAHNAEDISCRWDLLERTGKKAAFVAQALTAVEEAARTGGQKNSGQFLWARAVCDDLQQWNPRGSAAAAKKTESSASENFAKEFSAHPIRIVTARAFSPLNPVVIKQIKKIAPRATLMLYKGTRETIDKELAAVEGLLAAARAVPLAHPAGKERHLLIARFA